MNHSALHTLPDGEGWGGLFQNFSVTVPMQLKPAIGM